ncbi:hypothetical protein B0H34DRAFT_689118 [Crassisporium funariophilum]|nr:hypothetical protein B0H34DRAFT_689118 [Crassisporium funariophilum]
MLTRNSDSQATPRVGGKAVIALFVLSLFSFVAESQLTQHVQTKLGFRQPYFLFYLVHSFFAIIFPLHLLYLLATTDYTTVSLVKGLGFAIANHLDPGSSSKNSNFPYYKFIRLVLAMTVAITFPALLWFAAISLASMSDVTAIWNTNAFFAYIISVKLFKLHWQPRRLVAVSLATLGVVFVVYGGSKSTPGRGVISNTVKPTFKPSAPLLGCLLTLIASFEYGLYQVLYKIYAALPSDPEVASERRYEQIPEEEESNINSQTGLTSKIPEDVVYPPPFGFHPGLLASMLGFFTLVLLWIPIPILHYTGIEVFRLPQNGATVLAIIGIAVSATAVFMSTQVLLGVWGPVITSVGNLLSIVLMVISDIVFGAGPEVLTVWSLTGSGIIVLAFAVLASDMFKGRSS